MSEADWVRQATEIAILARRAMAPGLQKNDGGEAIYDGSCLYASVFLKELLEKFGGDGAVARVVGGGGGETASGAMDSRGAWRGHYWVEATRGGRTLIIEITGDQFGMAGVRVMTTAEATDVLRPGDQQEVDEADQSVLQGLGNQA